MRLNPYHPQRYWTHLGRASFHQGRFAEALTALEHVGRPRADNRVYRVAASARDADAVAIKRSVAELRDALQGIDAIAFVRSFPYEHERDCQTLLGALERAKIDP